MGAAGVSATVGVGGGVVAASIAAAATLSGVGISLTSIPDRSAAGRWGSSCALRPGGRTGVRGSASLAGIVGRDSWGALTEASRSVPIDASTTTTCVGGVFAGRLLAGLCGGLRVEPRG